MEPLPSTARRRAALAPLLHDPVPEVRASAALALDRLENRGNLAEVLQLLKTGVLPEKIQAIFALGEIGGEKVLPALVYCAGRPEVDIKVAALEVLGNLAAPETLSVVVKSLGDAIPSVQVKAIAALGKFRNLDAARLLIPFLDADDGLIDAEAARSVGYAGLAECEERLITLLQSRHEATREAAAEALGLLPF